MYKEIFFDYITGLTDSLKIHLLFQPLINNIKIKKLICRVIKYNLLIYLLPILISNTLYYWANISVYKIIDIIFYPIIIFSGIFHLIHYIEMVNLISSYSNEFKKNAVAKNNSVMSFIDVITIGLTMSIYQIVIFSTSELIKLIFYEQFYMIYIIFNFILLTIYHSFYCFNNLWQFMGIDMLRRIDIHEKVWAYYIGYGTISSIIYFYSMNQYMTIFYNIYILTLISIPFLINSKFPKKNMTYPKINLSIFSYLTGMIMFIIRIFPGKIFPENQL